MGTFKRIIDAITTPDSFYKGEEFESYVLKYFREDYWILKERTQSYAKNHERYEEKSLRPDLTFQHRESKKWVSIECKYRSSLFQGKLKLCEPYQLKRYKEMDKYGNTYIVCGVGGSAGNPEKLYIFKISDLKYNEIFGSILPQHEIRPSCYFQMEGHKLVQLDSDLSAAMNINDTINKVKKFFS